jgi:hypothetical protein
LDLKEKYSDEVWYSYEEAAKMWGIPLSESGSGKEGDERDEEGDVTLGWIQAPPTLAWAKSEDADEDEGDHDILLPTWVKQHVVSGVKKASSLKGEHVVDGDVLTEEKRARIFDDVGVRYFAAVTRQANH